MKTKELQFPNNRLSGSLSDIEILAEGNFAFVFRTHEFNLLYSVVCWSLIFLIVKHKEGFLKKVKS